MKSTVQNIIFRDWIRKKWIFVRQKIHFFAFQPYMGEDSVEAPAEGFCGRSLCTYRSPFLLQRLIHPQDLSHAPGLGEAAL